MPSLVGASASAHLRAVSSAVRAASSATRAHGEIELDVEGQPAAIASKRRVRKRSKHPAPIGTSTTGLPPGPGADVSGADMQSLLERIEQLESRARVEVEAQPAAEADGEQPAEEPQPAEKSQPEVVMKAAGEVSAEEIEEIPSPPLILSSVIVWTVQNANTRAGVLRASAWLICGLIFALAEITSLLSVGVSLQWKPCFAQEDCRLGQVCISFYEGVYFRSTCEDCYFVAKDETVAAPADWLYPDVISPEDRLGFGDDEVTTGAARQGKGRGGSVLAVASANSTVSASEFCLRQLRGKAIALFEPDESIYFGGSEEPAEFEPHFRECHYVKEALQTMSRLDKTIVLLVLMLVAFGAPRATTSCLFPCACPFCDGDGRCR